MFVWDGQTAQNGVMSVNGIAMSIIVPTRDRAIYLEYCLRACLEHPGNDIEIIVLDNASSDNTRQTVEKLNDSRLSYRPSNVRLSMRQNFERGLEHARGEILCFLGDDDGLIPSAIPAVLEWMADPAIAAVSNTRAHYGWPDFNESRRDTLLIPRHRGERRLNSRHQLRSMLHDVDYYSLPCLYHGFVRRSLVERVRVRDGDFFQSSQVDMYSAIALSMEDVTYVHSDRPLVVNGGSRRSNGASYQGQTEDEEKKRWIREDDVGFLEGFENPISVGCAVLESALRYSRLRNVALENIFDRPSIVAAAMDERARRQAAGRPAAETAPMLAALGIAESEIATPQAAPSRLGSLITSFRKLRPIDARREGISNVHGAAVLVDRALREKMTGFFDHPLQQARAAMMFARRGRSGET